MNIVYTALRFLRQKLDVNVDIEEMETEAAEADCDEDVEKKDESYSMKRLLTEKTLMVPLLITVILQVAQQFSGINAVSQRNKIIITS